jgi:hypothetical protein
VLVIAHRESEGGSPEIKVDRLELDREDALIAQLRSFLSAIAQRRVEAGAADQGLAALRTALRVVDAMPPLDGPAP